MFNLPGQSVDPTLLSLDELSESIDVASLARSLFRADVGSHPASKESSDNPNDSVPSSTRLQRTMGLQQPAPETVFLTEFEHEVGHHPFRDGCSSTSGAFDMGLLVEHSSNNNIQVEFPVSNSGGEASWYNTEGAARQSHRPPEKQPRVYRNESGQGKKRRGCATSASVDVFGMYLSEEVRKCKVFGHLPPQDTFLTLAIQEEIQELETGKNEVLAKILIHIASPCLIGGLQGILESCKTGKSSVTLETTSTLSTAERLRLIATLGHTISYAQLLRRYHILGLFKDCGGLETSMCGVIMTLSNFASSSNTRGNPINRSVADVTVKMMAETFPAIGYQTSEYRAKYRWISYVRRLGQRLHLLETRFGQGILGLILDQGITGTDTGITDAM
jgi:hypothetical protein